GAAREKPAPLADLLGNESWRASRYGVLQTVALLAEFFPPLNAYVSAGAAAPIALAPQALPAFLFDTLPIIRLLGIRALLPKALDRLLRPKLSMKVEAKGAPASGLLNAADLFRFDWTVAIGAAQLSPAEFEQLVARAEGVIQFKGEYVYLDPLEIAKLRAQLERPPQPDGAELLRIALAEEYGGAPVLLDADARAVIKQLTEIGPVAPPAGLNAALRPYQERGYAWLHRNLRAGFGSVIADDMGLGKTLQVIATLLKLKEEGALEAGKALVIVPTSLLTNWAREIARFAPGLSTEVFHGAARALAKGRPDVLLTTYGMARADLAKLKKLDWRVVVVDEAQNIKNPAAAQTKAVKAIPAGAFIAMSGTPVENRLSEYWSIMDFANRGMLGTLAGFDKEFAAPIQSRHDRQVAQRFQRVTAPFLLRRLKSDKSVISDLPDKIEQDQYCELSGEQSALYESVLREALRVIAGESDAFQRQGLVLQMIMALKQICNHPAQYLKLGAGEAERSGKAQLFLELLDAIHASHEKVIVFTQFREMGELLAGWIGQRFGRAPQFLHGGVARKRRDEMVERFQNDRTERVFLLSLKAGGTGLNLTAASNVIHYDLWWNPAVEAQATDRAYRIGQLRNVQVHRLITRATFEEKINDMIAAKRGLADLTVGAGEQWIGNLSNAELRDVFSLR
ncbi:MAG: DEAD/DEAH box helicase, partial [Burkholderiaceae bacterium]|nr:DEAD/DEAH box helicase [Burkholderiaceae bacterium]